MRGINNWLNCLYLYRYSHIYMRYNFCKICFKHIFQFCVDVPTEQAYARIIYLSLNTMTVKVQSKTVTSYELTSLRVSISNFRSSFSRTAEVAVELINEKNGSTDVSWYCHEGDEVKDVSVFRHCPLHFNVCRCTGWCTSELLW